VLVDLPLDESHIPKQICRVRWHVALKEMLRKRALVAGRHFNPIPMLIVIGVWCQNGPVFCPLCWDFCTKHAIKQAQLKMSSVQGET